jgi:hypothetical protein
MSLLALSLVQMQLFRISSESIDCMVQFKALIWVQKWPFTACLAVIYCFFLQFIWFIYNRGSTLGTGWSKWNLGRPIMMEAVMTFETSVYSNKATQCYISEGSNFTLATMRTWNLTTRLCLNFLWVIGFLLYCSWTKTYIKYCDIVLAWCFHINVTSSLCCATVPDKLQPFPCTLYCCLSVLSQFGS